MVRKKTTPATPAAPVTSGEPPNAARPLKIDRKPAATGFPVKGFLNKKPTGNTSSNVSAAVAPPPATIARGEAVCSISSNPRLRDGSVLAKQIDVDGGNTDGSTLLGGNSSVILSKTSIEAEQNLKKVISDASLGFVEPEILGIVDNIAIDPVASKKGWASLFGLNRNENKGFKLIENFTGVTSAGVVLDEEDRQDNAKIFFRLVGYFSPRFPGIDALKQMVKKWDCKCKSYQHASNWTVFTFDTEADMIKVLEGGPYFIYGKSLYLKKLPPMFDFGWSGHTILPVWVQLPNLSLDFWNEKALGKLCSFIGKPLHTDAATKEQQNLSFARALIEVDVSIVLPTEMPVTYPDKIVRTQKIFYEDVPKYCQTCRKMGHLTDTCSSDKFATPKLYVKKTQKPVQNVQKPAASRPVPHLKKQKNVATTTEWVVQGKKKKGKNHAETEEEKENVSDVLGLEEDEEKEDMREYGTDRGASDYVATDGYDDKDEDEDDDEEESDFGSEDALQEEDGDERDPEVDRDTVVPTEGELAEFLFKTMDAMDSVPSTSVEDAGDTVIALAANEKSVGTKNTAKGQKGEKMKTSFLSTLTLADIPIQEDKRARKKTVQEELVQLRIESKKKEDEWRADREATLTRSRAKVAKQGD